MKDMKDTDELTIAEITAVREAEQRALELEEREKSVVRDPRTMRIVKGALFGPNTGVQIRFEMQKSKNALKTAAARKKNPNAAEVYDEVEWYWKNVPGMRDNINGPVVDSVIWEFPNEYELFKKGHATGVIGVPLDQWDQVTMADRAELARHGVFTVDALAGMSDGNAGVIRGLQSLKAKAAMFLEMHNKSSRDDEVAELRAQLAELTALVKKGNSAK